ncbi:MAG: hypothetical protein EXR77_17100 [Myxococcales bacterium]|nr:hypothetical protein [Myxococcales bacterium]
MAQDADTKEIDALAAEAAAAQCSGFNCGCGPPAPTFCLSGQCKQCPPDCDGSCDELSAAIITLAKQQGSYCGKDDDCTVLTTGLCPLGDLPCGGVPISKYAKPDQLNGLIAVFAPKCPASTCKCMAPGKAVCKVGKCSLP